VSNRFAACAFAAFLSATLPSPSYGQPQDQPAATQQQEIHPLNAPGQVKISSRTRTVEIQDPAWGITAVRFQIPADWSFDGIIIRDNGCGLTPSIAWRISSPDGLSGAQMMPDFGSHWSTDPTAMRSVRQFHCKIMEPLGAEDFLGYVAPLARPNPTLSPLEPTDDAAQFQQSIDRYNQRSRAAFGTAPESGGAVRSRIQYVYRGQTIEENFAVRLQTFKTRNRFPGGPVHFTWLTTANVRTIRGPKGQLDEVIRAIAPLLWAGGYGFTPEWEQRFNQNLQNDTALAMAAQQRQAAATQAMLNQNHDAFMKAQNDRFNAGQQQWKAHMDEMSRSAQAYTLYAGDNQLVRNQQTGVVSTVTNKYGTNAYQEDGTNNILLNNTGVNPNLYLRGTYTQLENVDPMKPY
jgi:hypothetical protein